MVSDRRASMEEERKRKVLVRSFTEHLTCVLCGGYFIDATSIAECLHTFCKTCIIGYLETSVYCPVCDAQVNDTKPTLSLRRDQTLQNVVYKLVPGLLSSEIKRRKDFIEQNGDPGDSGICDESANVDENIDGRFYREDEQISVCLQFNPYGKSAIPRDKKHKHRSRHSKRVPRRFLLCPAPFTIGHFKKFLRTKHDFNNNNNNQNNRLKVAIFHSDEALPDHYTLMDVAYIYSWRRTGPLRLYYSFYEGPDPPLPPMKMPRPRRQENIEDWNKLEGFFDSPPCSPTSLDSRSPSPNSLRGRRGRGSCSPVFDRFPSFPSSGRHLSGLSSHLSFKQNGSRLDLSETTHKRGRCTRDDDWREPAAKRIKQEEPDDNGSSPRGFSEQATTPSRCGVERSSSAVAAATDAVVGAFAHPIIPDTLRFTPLTKENVRRASAFQPTTPLASKASAVAVATSAAVPTSARLSLSVTLPKNFIKDLLIARDMEKLIHPKIKMEAQ